MNIGELLRLRRSRSTPWLLACVALLLGLGVWVRSAVAEDAPGEPPRPPMEALFMPLREAIKNTPAFFRDTDLTIHFRSYYFNREKPDATENEAWAFGGWLAYKSGWLLDTFGIGATFYGSAPLYAPDDKDGTLLLKPGQEGYAVIGEAYAALRYQDYAVAKGYRQLVDQPYINPQDNRMTPNTFEGVTVSGKVDIVQYFVGYLWAIKPRNSDEFISMARQAGATSGSDDVVMIGARITPLAGLRIDAASQYAINMFHTLYAEAQYDYPLNEAWKLRIGGQFTDQRAVGDQLVATAAEKDWSTQQGGLRLSAISGPLTLTTAFSITGSGNTIQAPWGSFPGYLSLIDQDFDRANEKAVLIGAAYDFSKLLTQGLAANVNIAWGWDAINPKTRAAAPDQTEYDLTVDYRPPVQRPSFLQGMWLRVRGAILDQQGADQLGWQVRLILNWERDLL